MFICGKLEVVKAAGSANQASLTTDHTLIRYNERVSWGSGGLQSILQMHSSCRQAKAAFFLSFFVSNTTIRPCCLKYLNPAMSSVSYFIHVVSRPVHHNFPLKNLNKLHNILLCNTQNSQF